MDQYRCERDERRIAMIPAMTNLLIVKRQIVLGGGQTQNVMARMISLDQDASATLTAAGAAGYLGNQLKCSLRGAKVGQSQSRIDGNNSYQGYVWKVMTLRQHLRANEHVEFTLAEIVNIFAVADRAYGWRHLPVIAIVTNQGAIAAMISQGDVAVRTANRFTARAAQNE